MDPIIAIGFAANILSFIDYSSKVISAGIEIYESASGNTKDTQNSDTVATTMKNFATKLQPPHRDQISLSEEERALCKLAAECESLANRILDLLDKFKPKNRKSRGSTLMAGLKTKWYESDRRKLEEQLNHCRAQLSLQLNYLASSNTQEKLEALVTSAKDDSSKIQHIHTQVRDLHRGIAIESLTPSAQGQLRSLFSISEHACDLIAQHRIIESLAFEGMHGRYEVVDNAHFKTLRWIFNELPDNGQATTEEGSEEELDSKSEADRDNEVEREEDAAKTSARNLLLDWLSSGTGTLHISGKLGSGKSTLMKYLCEHASTKSLLREWAGERQLVFANFFFWKPGTPMQKSLTGLIRSLLHDVLKQCPHLIPAILPNYWRQVKSTPWQIQSTLPFTDKEIREAFSHLISKSNLYTDHCFCFFIDGLDEYEGTYQEDSKTLVSLLDSWTSHASHAVKLCVSSREYNVFMNAFAKEQRICLHDLTRLDMTQYVLSKLRHMDPYAERIALANAIVYNAQGIFVWTTLVVKRIREQMENGANLDNLKQEVNSFPRELNELFEYIFDSIPDSDFKMACLTFSMVLELNSGFEISLCSYSFLDEFAQDSQFALREEFQRQSLTHQAIERRIEYARERLIGRCKDFLETRTIRNDDPTGECIGITHRSISEFLSSTTQRDRIERTLLGFNTVDAISQLTLAELWLMIPIYTNKRNTPRIAEFLVPFRNQAKLDVAPYSFLTSLASAWKKHQDQGNYSFVEDELWVPTQYPVWVTILVGRMSPAEAKSSNLSRCQSHLHPIYSAAVCGNYDYVLWELHRGTHASPDFAPVQLVYCLLVGLIYHESGIFEPGEKGIKDILDCLHAHYNIHHNTPSNLFYTSLYPLDKLDEQSASGSLDSRDGDVETIIPLWHHIILRYYRLENILSNIRGSNLFSYFMEKFLEYGADPYFYISVSNCPNLRMKLVTRCQGEIQEQLFVSSPKEQGVKHIEKDEMRQARYECEDVSLADLIELWDFEKKARILELIKENFSRLGGEKKDTVMWIREVASPEKQLLVRTPIMSTEVDSGSGEVTELPFEQPQTLSIDENFKESGFKKSGLTEGGKLGSWNLLGLLVLVSVGVLVFGILIAIFSQRV